MTFFFLHRLQRENYYNTLYRLPCPTSKNLMGSDRCYGGHNPLFLFFSPKPLFEQRIILFTVLKEWCWNVIFCELTVSNEMGPIILDALIAHHTPILMLCKGSLWINEVFSVDQHFRDFTHSLGRLKVSSPNRKSVVSVSPACVGLTDRRRRGR